MTHVVSDPKENVICRCSGTTLRQLECLFERGVRDLDGISRASGACSGCGACEYDLAVLVAGCTENEARPSATATQ